MKKLSLAILIFLLFPFVSLGQEVKIFLPLILKGDDMPAISEKWKVISPVESTNYVLNPSAESTGNYSALGAAIITRNTTYQKYGNYSYRVQTGLNGQGLSLTLLALPNESCFATARIRGNMPTSLKFIIGTGIKTPLLIEKIDTQWALYGVMFNATECNGRTEFRIIQQGSGLGDFYVDGIQVENLEYWTSYIDGDQEGCIWNGPEHGASSTRSAFSLAGGQVKSLFADYGFLVEKVIGAGAVGRNLEIDSFAFLPGGEINDIKIKPRQWSLIGKFVADSDDEFYNNRQELLKLLRKNAQKEPVKFLFYHPRGIKEIKAFYSEGLEGDQATFYDSWVIEGEDKWANLNKYIEKSSIQLVSPDPYFYGQGNKSAALDTEDSATFRYIAGRLKSTGQWTNMGPPNAGGTYTSVEAFAEDNTYLYIGGNFLNFDNIANADYIVRYNKQTGTYSALGTGMNGVVQALTIAPDGKLYAGGAFTIAGGTAANYIAYWNGSSWGSLGSGTGNVVRAIIITPDGTIYVGGDFTTAGGGAANRIAKWNGIGWSALGTGMNTGVYCLAADTNGTLYAGGAFTTAGGNTVNYIAKWDGSSWSALGAGMGNLVTSIEIEPDGDLYAGGTFSTAGGVTVNKVAKWNGSSWSGLGVGIGTGGFYTKLSIGPDGTIYVGGDFTGGGGIAIADRIVKWNGSVYSQLDIDLPGTPTIYSVLASKNADPVIPQKYDLYLGFDVTGTATYAGKAIVTNSNNVMIFPKFIFKRVGGTAITLNTLTNFSTGRELLFNYTLLDGERLIIDLTPGKKSIISNYFGSRLDAILPNSDFNSWVLEPGENIITTFALDNFVLYPSSFEAFIQWQETFESYD